MSKIICDVCGTSYPDTAAQCPICGYARSVNAQQVPASSGSDSANRSYTYVKGGRFSKSNVKKRNAAVKKSGGAAFSDEPANRSVTALVVIVFILFFAIIAVVAFLAIRYFVPFSGNSVATTASTAATEEKVKVVSIKLDTTSMIFDEAGKSRMLYATVLPSNVTDDVVFTSDAPEIAKVTKGGKVTAVAPGKAIITATCGDKSVKCIVTCEFEDPNAATTEESTVPETEPAEELKLNRKDITFSQKDDSWVLYNGNIDKSKIKWSSDNESVAKFENGKVTAIGPGTTEVTAECGSQKVSCIIRCSFQASSGVSGTGGVSEDG